MQENLLENQNEPSWLDLLLECIEADISPSEVQAFISQCSTFTKQA